VNSRLSIGCLALLAFTPALSAQTTRPRIAIGQFAHESNSFNPIPTGYADFLRRTNLDEMRKSQDEVSGFLEGGPQTVNIWLADHATPDEHRHTSDLRPGDLLPGRSAPKLDGLLRCWGIIGPDIHRGRKSCGGCAGRWARSFPSWSRTIFTPTCRRRSSI
jgi:hypothetical protein